jgi:hypothetical protein
MVDPTMNAFGTFKRTLLSKKLFPVLDLPMIATIPILHLMLDKNSTAFG